MAGNKETPRQKMINIMYLVFIAMLALNISKQVLATIGVLEENLENSISQAENEIAKKVSAIENKKGQANIQSAYSSVVLMNEKSDKYFDYLGTIIDSLLAQDKEKNKFYREVENDAPANERTLPDVVKMRDYQIMDKGNVLDKKFFDGDENTPFGNEFILNYKNYKSDFISIVDSIKIKDSQLEEPVFNDPDDDNSMVPLNDVLSDLEQRFIYSEKKLASDGTEVPFLEYEFKGFPLIASMAKMTKIQNDIRYMQNKLLSAVLGDGELPLVSYLLPARQQNYAGEVFDGSLVMGQKSSNFSFGDVQLQLTDPNNNKVNLTRDVDYDIEKGQILFKKRLNLSGDYNLTGTVTKQGARTEDVIKVDQTFTLFAKPTSATIEAIRLNILYVKMNNPVNIAFDAAQNLEPTSATRNVTLDKNINSSDRAEGANFYAVPTIEVPKGQEGEAFIEVSGIINGKREKSGIKKFRVLPIPDGTGSISLGTSFINDGESAPQRRIINGEITGSKDKTFLYDLNIEVKSFRVTVEGQQSIVINDKYIARNPLAVTYIQSAPSGARITIDDIVGDAWEGDNVNRKTKIDIDRFDVFKQ